MRLARLEKRPHDWDLAIQAYKEKTLFHESAWLDFVTSSRPDLNVDYFRIEDQRGIAGYFCTFRARKLNVSMWGCPFPGTGMYLGPLLRSDVDQKLFLSALIRYCTGEIGHLQMAIQKPDIESMIQAGFRVNRGWNFICPLDHGEEAVWLRMRGTCRTRIRKAERYGLYAEITSDSAIVSQFYGQFVSVLRSKNIPVPYALERPAALFHHLQPANRLFAVRVFHCDRVVATGLFPNDDRAMYYWDGGYDSTFLHLSPNELLHWTAIKAAIARGIPTFEIGGAPQPSRFVQKFGGALVPYVTAERGFAPLFSMARTVYRHIRDRFQAYRRVGG
jgi:hypothetical protein